MLCTCCAAAAIVVVSACSRKEGDDGDEEYVTTPYELIIPPRFPPMVVPGDNPMTKEGVELGRRLYYDPDLSLNGPNQGFSCASCHVQEVSFTVNTTGTAVLPHVNLGWNKNFLWDGKVAGSIEDIMRFEVETFFQSDMQVLQQDKTYREMFRKAFASDEITARKAELAMAQFIRTLISGNSRYDRWRRGDGLLNASELSGLSIFFTEKGDCFHCHSTPFFSDNDFHNIGLETVYAGEGRGRYNVTGNPEDMGKFKTPTLRNIELTAPYMHDGRFGSLEEVVHHYNLDVQPSATLDPIMTKPMRGLELELTQQEEKDLVSFLKALTDTTFIYDKAHQSPF
ncbi:MAG: cytochrome-c peroxidase [Flavobacteriales bacterium]|nr:cytochrome-c peroxidase [Flavobacteriales bacterium]